MTSRGEAARAVLIVGAGALVALGALALTWAWGQAPVLPGAPGSRTLAWTGAQLNPWAPACAIVSGLSGVAVLGTRTWGRTLAGAVGAAAAAAVAIGSIATGVQPPSEATSLAPWWIAAAAGALAALSGAILILVRGPRWPGLGSRYERAAVSEWDRIGRGEDPTVDPPDGRMVG